MTVLKARVGGAWQTIGGGSMLPAGGAAGDLLTKNSATNFDAVWGTAIPVLSLTNTNTLSSITASPIPLVLGTLGSLNLAFDRLNIQARNNGAASTLFLNPWGGEVDIGGGNAQYQSNLALKDSTHATSRRAMVAIGSGWLVGQDLNANGTKDLYIYNNANTRTVALFNANAQTISLGDGVTNIDIYLAGIQTTPNLATSPRISSDSTWIDIHAKTDVYLDGNTIYFRNAAYGNQGNINGGNLSIPGNITAGGYLSGLDVYCGSGYWFRVSGNNGVYWQIGAAAYICPTLPGFVHMVVRTSTALLNYEHRLLALMDH